MGRSAPGHRRRRARRASSPPASRTPSRPATQFEYSNLGYGADRPVRRPAGRRAVPGPDDPPPPRAARDWRARRGRAPADDDWARPYRVEDGAARADGEPLGDGALAPMGGLWSNVEDLVAWMSWLDDAFPARDGADDGPLRRSSRRELQQVHRATALTRGPAVRRGPRPRAGAHRRRRLRVRAPGAPRRPLRLDRRALRRPARVRLEHALAPRAAGRRGGPGQLDVRPDAACSPGGCSRLLDDHGLVPPITAPAVTGVPGRPPSGSSPCSRLERRRSPPSCSPTTWPSTSPTTAAAAAGRGADRRPRPAARRRSWCPDVGDGTVTISLAGRRAPRFDRAACCHPTCRRWSRTTTSADTADAAAAAVGRAVSLGSIG